MSKEEAFFLIESGHLLDAAKKFVADYLYAREKIITFCKGIGVDRFVADRLDYSLLGVVFKGEPLEGFKRPDKKGVSYPKVTSDWAARMKDACPGIGLTQTQRIEAIWPVPTWCNYEGENSSGSCCIGDTFMPMYFLFPHEEGPFAVLVPDVPAHLAYRKSLGERVTNIPEDYKLEFPGLKRISEDEWDLICLQDKIARDKAEKAAQEAQGYARQTAP